MSLIADALKAAQRDRETQRSAPDADARDRYASSALRAPGSVGATKVRRREPTSTSTWVIGTLFALAWIIAGWVYFTPDNDEVASLDQPIEPFEADALPGGPGPNVSGGTSYPAPDFSSLPSSSFVPYEPEVDPEPAGRSGGFAGAQGLIDQGIRQVTDRLSGVSSRFQELATTATGVVGSRDDEDENPEILAAETETLRLQMNSPAGAGSGVAVTMQARSIDSVTLFRQALEAQQYGNNEEAITLYQNYLAANPNDSEGYNNLGTVLQSAGRMNDARTAFERALAINGQYSGAWSNLGLVLQQLGHDTDARAALNEALRLDPGNVGVRVNLALLLERLGQVGDARAQLETALEHNPRHPEAHYALARLLDGDGDRTTALNHYQLFLAYGQGRFPEYESAVRSRISELESYGYVRSQ